MAVLTDSQLAVLANTIQNNTSKDSNSASLVGAFLNDLVESKLNKSLFPYLLYSAQLSQSGTSDPAAIVFCNNLVGNVVWTRSALATYDGTLIGGFDISKTGWVISDYFSYNTQRVGGAVSNDLFRFSQKISDTLADGFNIYIEIKVYL